MIEDFKFFIKSVVEDYPIPLEIKEIYFYINFKNGINELSMFGDELFNENRFRYEYNPLDAQFFFNRQFCLLKKQYASLKLKYLIIESLEDRDIIEIFKSKNLHIVTSENGVIYTIRL